MQLVIPAFHAARTGVGDVFPGIAPLNLVAFILHVLNKALPIRTVQQSVLDGLDQRKLPALAPLGGAVFSRQHTLFLLPLVIALQHRLAVGHADFIVDPAVLYQVIVILVQLFAGFKADRVDQKVVVEVVGVAWVATKTS